MAKQDKSFKTGFLIKLSSETVQKLSEEEQQSKTQHEEMHKEELEESGLEFANEKTVNLKPPSLDNHNAKKEESEETKQNVENVSKSDIQTSVSLDETSNSNAGGDEKNSEATNVDKSSWGDYAPYIAYEGEEAIYTDPSSNLKYSWNKETSEWTPKSKDVPGRVYSYADDTHVYTEADGSKYFWDVDKKAWIPKVDDDFMAFYQMSYGFVDNSKPEDEKDDKRKVEKNTETITGTKRKNESQWFQPSEDTNTKVYVSNLPLDITEEEFVNFMQKCGLVERDPSNQKMKVKLYIDKEHHCFKGDALCTYIKIESVDLALKLLDGSDLKGNTIKVERAHFQMKGDYNPALKPKKKKKKELEKIKKMQQKLFDWRPEKFVGERSKHERVVIVKNLFHPSDFDNEVQLILDYQQDLREESTKSGEVRKVVIYDRHPEGVAQITMKEPEQADAVVQLINGRWFGKRQITAEIWDGRTKYRIAETDADISKRINKWENFLEQKEGEGSKENSTNVGNSSGTIDKTTISSESTNVENSSGSIVSSESTGNLSEPITESTATVTQTSETE